MNPQRESVSHGVQRVGSQKATCDSTPRNAVTGRRRPARAFHNEPLTDFSRARTATRCARHWRRCAAQFGRTYPVVIDNTPQPVGEDARQREPVAHERNRRQGRARRRVEQANAAVGVVPEGVRRLARHAGRASGPSCCAALAEQFRKRRFELSAWIVFETGKPWRESDADVAEAIDFCEYYAPKWRSSRAPQHRDVPGEDNRYFYEPRGVAVVIAPWNFPLAILTGMADRRARRRQHGHPEAGRAVGRHRREADGVLAGGRAAAGRGELPPGRSARRSARRWSTHPDVALIAFTGSLKVGAARSTSRREDAAAGRTSSRR